MRDLSRIPRIIDLLEIVWDKYPDLRLGQLISNLLGPGPHDVFFVEDTEWERLLNEFIKENS